MLVEKTSLQQDLQCIEDSAARTARAFAAAAVMLNHTRSTLWALPDERLLALLNFMGPAKVQEIFGQHFFAATTTNKILDDFKSESARAISSPEKELTVNNQGLFEIVYPKESITEEN